ncbi:MAG: hypothetical protein PHP23_00260 [Desulfobacterales bacterium]|nr:hypothetical protein [Desulfobacterales bacterium]MDD4073412.1 hypothetical protein [Desulfobacterales bacterium]MDD4391582.1 hypothetical protein [Desulfobacterales bacterium]
MPRQKFTYPYLPEVSRPLTFLSAVSCLSRCLRSEFQGRFLHVKTDAVEAVDAMMQHMEIKRKRPGL